MMNAAKLRDEPFFCRNHDENGYTFSKLDNYGLKGNPAQ
jgi:hypothetical protein